MPPTSNRRFYIVIFILAVLLILSLGWNALMMIRQNPFTVTSLGKVGVSPSSFFDFNNVGVTGKITAVNGNKLSVTNKRNVTGEVVLSDSVSISNFSNSGATPPSTNPNDLVLDKEASILLQVENGEYRAHSITYSVPVTNDPTASAAPLPDPVPGGVEVKPPSSSVSLPPAASPSVSNRPRPTPAPSVEDDN
jgi:hypothetical protein